jgi:hypothetical protein
MRKDDGGGGAEEKGRRKATGATEKADEGEPSLRPKGNPVPSESHPPEKPPRTSAA